jgi:hypothetical protein
MKDNHDSDSPNGLIDGANLQCYNDSESTTDDQVNGWQI